VTHLPELHTQTGNNLDSDGIPLTKWYSVDRCAIPFRNKEVTC